ncbi:UDP-3-O-[3-hydroxymyristoyl] glucosamine N-acyltransferase lpxD [Candidatus Kinetoplastibacterium blastocrithidii TCC012E]|uniref:UDP-3-O-acylglucosamine N-acyltransferase n=1 Tax=Candidatus Kinetoplastidibacterium blastocrithidiae TCC012E TaxID=1208922 RepID=M1M3S6_9PROT|nr:UDP-3-O-(3-hydroxymyristoyl)glucosamine N-acyltransferase [Candidatus Kinetoplastibacterium blastocrithidii]AFZ83638.1 UDP-3-O-[3-hydroxymyristoyl] glucosamine N-acyltransferase [Candidatus Kinetoplastibacterium blastocrithidii (ex Strigomonas culicis)]AGF49759.1 UDP-3-O-[3-hydroxymyristoyl] glucosamine N-acyltransferase lpxD [Candidatus Kinetoplastibacterium blastocrithidii TCC012E]
MPTLLDKDQSIDLGRLLSLVDTSNIDLQLILADDSAFIMGISSLSKAIRGDITFLNDIRYIKYVSDTNASAIIVSDKIYSDLIMRNSMPDCSFIVCNNPYLLYARVTHWFNKQLSKNISQNIHSSAIVSTDSIIGHNVEIGPHSVIGPGVVIGRDAKIGSGCAIGKNSDIGDNCLIHSRVTLYPNTTIGSRSLIHSGVVLGADGFGYALDKSSSCFIWNKIYQFGRVEIGSDVEIGANTTIDRGALDNTVIGNGVKLDNQVMIGHNVIIGDGTAIAACVGIAGSTKIGKRCSIAGAAMVSGHITIVDDVHISGATAIISNIIKSGRYTGIYPYSTHSEWQHNAPIISKLSKIRKLIKSFFKK